MTSWDAYKGKYVYTNLDSDQELKAVYIYICITIIIIPTYLYICPAICLNMSLSIGLCSWETYPVTEIKYLARWDCSKIHILYLISKTQRKTLQGLLPVGKVRVLLPVPSSKGALGFQQLACMLLAMPADIRRKKISQVIQRSINKINMHISLR